MVADGGVVSGGTIRVVCSACGGEQCASQRTSTSSAPITGAFTFALRWYDGLLTLLKPFGLPPRRTGICENVEPVALSTRLMVGGVTTVLGPYWADDAIVTMPPDCDTDQTPPGGDRLTLWNVEFVGTGNLRYTPFT